MHVLLLEKTKQPHDMLFLQPPILLAVLGFHFRARTPGHCSHFHQKTTDTLGLEEEHKDLEIGLLGSCSPSTSSLAKGLLLSLTPCCSTLAPTLQAA